MYYLQVCFKVFLRGIETPLVEGIKSQNRIRNFSQPKRRNSKVMQISIGMQREGSDVEPSLELSMSTPWDVNEGLTLDTQHVQMLRLCKHCTPLTRGRFGGLKRSSCKRLAALLHLSLPHATSSVWPAGSARSRWLYEFFFFGFFLFRFWAWIHTFYSKRYFWWQNRSLDTWNIVVGSLARKLDSQ